MKCIKCGTELEDGVLFCRECGAKVTNNEVRFCRNCGKELKAGVKFCTSCGAKVSLEENIHPISVDNAVKDDSVVKAQDTPKTEAVLQNQVVIHDKPVVNKVYPNRLQVPNSKKNIIPKTEEVKREQNKKKSLIPVLAGLAALLFIVLPILKSGTKKSGKDNNDVSNKTEVQELTNYTIEKGSEYAFMSGEADVYIAKAVSEEIITIEHWDKSLLTSKKLNYVKDIGSYKINEPENGFSWIDDEHMAFRFTFQDSSTSAVKKRASHIFTIDIYENDEYKGTNLCDKVPGYSYTNDDWHMYFAIPLTDRFIKIERWSRPNSFAGFCFAGDWCVIDTDSSDIDFEWTDDEKTSFTITTQDSGNSSYWKENKLVVFKLENPDYSYSSIYEYLVNKNPVLADDETTVPDSSSSFKYDNYKDVEQKLREAGFTNITTEIQYDIVWGWTSEGEVEKVTINGTTSYNKGDIFKIDVPIVIFYHMKEEDDPNKQTVEETEPSQPAESEPVVEPVPDDISKTEEKTEERPKEDTKKEDDESVYYSSNTKSTVKQGNSGVYAYKNKGGQYSVYYIVDMDKGYVYYFCDGNGDTTCDRVKIVSGTLNDVIIITYHDGGDTWSYGLHFKWKNSPEHLIVQDEDGYEWDFYATDLSSALSKRASKTIYDY